MLENIYKLDRFLTVEYMKQLVEKNGFTIVNDPSNDIEKTLDYYKQHLSNTLSAPYILSDDQYFQQQIPINNDEYYIMKWSIPKSRYLIERYNIPLTDLSVDLIKTSVQQYKNSDLLSFESTKRDDKSSIIVCFYPPIASKYIIMDGVEEVIAKLESGAETIKAHVLDPYVHTRVMAGDVFRTLFAVHFNYSLMCSYIAGSITIKELEQRLFLVY